MEARDGKAKDPCFIGGPPVVRGEACSGLVAGELHCKHGHVQTNACRPRWSDTKERWYPNFAPTCCDEDLAERLAPRFGGLTP